MQLINFHLLLIVFVLSNDMDSLFSNDNINENDHQAPKGSLTEQYFRAEVSSIVFKSDDGSYCVLRALDEKDNIVSIVGALESLAEGQDFEAWGSWERHKEFGRQFRVNRYKALLPSNVDGIKRYLASGLFKGIGQKTAERIVDKFGLETINILDNYSSRLSEVPGLGKDRIKKIKAAWTTQVGQRETDVFLQSLGITPSYCRRVIKHFGPTTAAIIKENPYRLTEVRGIGFKLADKAAMNSNIEKSNPFRLEAGVCYVMKELSERSGHCCFPLGGLADRASKTLEVDDELARLGIRTAVDSGQLICDDKYTSEVAIYPPKIYQAEVELASIISKIPQKFRNQQAHLPVSEGWGILNKAQQDAVYNSFQHHISIITGGPGVGKTTVIREIVHIAKALKLKFALAAPTGRAAKRMTESCLHTAQTIHRLLKWDPEEGGFIYGNKKKLSHDLLIIDEVSMIDVMLANQLFRALPFNCRIVLVGDKDQLPSVGAGKVLADLLYSRRVKTTSLTEVYRQGKNSFIIGNAHKVNRGEIPDLASVPKSAELRDFYWIEQDDLEKAVETIKKMASDRIPNRFGFNPLTDVQILAPMSRGQCGVFNLNYELQELLNPREHGKSYLKSGDVSYRPGDRVMQIVNNYDLKVFNGDLGTYKGIDEGMESFTVLYDSGEVQYPMEDVDQIRLAYAITIHKSQGSEFPCVIVPVLNSHFVMLQRKLIYTAMTRASKLLIMVGSYKAMRIAVNNFNTAPRHSLLAHRLKQQR